MAPTSFNRHGGLTLVPMPGFEKLARVVQEKVEGIGRRENQFETSVDVVEPGFGFRASGEPFLQLGKDHIGGHDCVVLTSGPGTPVMFQRLLLLLAYLAGRRAERITVVAGYLPLGRSDKDEGAQELALPPLVIHLMEQASYGRLDRIISVDLHAPQVVMSGRPGLITEVSLVRRLLERAVHDALAEAEGKVCLVFPDDGAVKRAESVIEQAERELTQKLPVVCGTKRRKSSFASSAGTLFGDVKALSGAVVLTLDDEIATGGTNVNVAMALKGPPHGAAKVWGVVTHGVLCGEAPARFLKPECPVDRVYVTDTIPIEGRPELQPLVDAGRLKVVAWADDLGWICYYHHWDKSLRVMR